MPPESPRSIRKVGFYGCSGKVIRLESRTRNYKKVMRLDCEGCGHTHDISIFWRAWKPELDKGKDATLV